MRSMKFATLALAAIAVPAAANEDLPPVGCVVQHSDRIPQGDLVALVLSNYAPTTDTGKATMQILQQVVGRCKQTNGWAKPKQDAAVRYFSSRILHDDAVAQGKRFGMSDGVVAGYVKALTPERRVAYASGHVTPEMNQAAFQYLQSLKVAAPGLAVEDLKVLGHSFNGGVFHLIAQQDAEKAYAG